MTQIDQSALESAIKTYSDPYLDCDLYALKAVRSLMTEGDVVNLKVAMPYACGNLMGAMTQLLSTALENVEGVGRAEVQIEHNIASCKSQNNEQNLKGVKNIIAVASGKGGVGKSTTSVNLALALAQEGAKVGILDADIYGPSVGIMLGIDPSARPKTLNNQYFIPIEAHGIKAMSMAFLVTEDTPMIWRGPMVSGALQQLLNQSMWEDLDYLIIDMPPGTGDIHLTLSQKVPVAGSVVVTTPQDVALLDCKKGIEMFRKVNIPVFGVIENMSVHICTNCGHHEHVFGDSGGERIAKEYDTDVLGQMPLVQTIREQTDSGNPTVVAEPDCEVSLMYQDMARKVAAKLAELAKDYHSPFPEIVVSSD